MAAVSLRTLVLTGVVGASTALQAQPASPPPAVKAGQSAPAKSQLRLVDVLLNGVKVGVWTLLEHDGGLYATADMLTEWRLILPRDAQPFSYRSQQWLPLFALPGYRARFDYSTQSVELEFAAHSFVGSTIADEKPATLELSPAAPALFLNYDLAHDESFVDGAGSTRSTGALTELGFALGGGTLISSQIGSNLASNVAGARSQWTRLETTWTHDMRDDRLTLRLGDTSTRPSMWGRSLYFGGLQLGTNFSLVPGFVNQAIPSLSGTATGPSTVELYVNDTLRQTSNVQPGPFTIENLSALTGSGQARVVVRDLLGRETVIERSFFTNSSLLALDLADWSINLGRERFNLGALDADYRDWFASGLYRRGMTPGLTLETRADWSAVRQGAGLGATASLPWQSLGQAALALSRDQQLGQGGKLLLGIDTQRLTSGFGARIVTASRDYRELGSGDVEPNRHEIALNYRQALSEGGSVGVSAARLNRYDAGRNSVLTASYAQRIGERATLNLSASRVSGDASGYSFNVYLSLPLGERQYLTANASKSRQGWDGYTSVTSMMEGETGLSWRALAGHQAADNFAEGGLYYQGGKGFLGADLRAAAQNQALRLNAQGGLVAMGGGLFAARRIQESFALVEVKGYPGIGVGFLGSALTRTDADGLALLPRLMPYQENRVRLDASDLPFSAELDSIEMTAVPSWRSGVKIAFPVRSGRGALLKIVLDDGEPAPAGAELELVGDPKGFFVARRGEAFVTGLQNRNQLRLNWNGQSCAFDVVLPPGTADDIARVGPITCQGVKR